MRSPRLYVLFCLCVLLAFSTSKYLGFSVLGTLAASSAARGQGGYNSSSGGSRVSHK